MNLFIRLRDDAESLGPKATKRLQGVLASQPGLRFCAAAGSTPLRTYQLLAEHRARQPQFFRKLRVVKFDEWGGLALDDPGRCEQQFLTHLLGPLGVSDGLYLGFRSDAPDPDSR